MLLYALQKRVWSLIQCDGKESFDSWQIANEVLTRRNKKHKRQTIYRCPHCYKYHLGSKQRRFK